MKSCPQCKRVETDEGLKFCRVDGAPLINHSSSVDQEAGTVRLGSGFASGEVNTGSLSHSTSLRGDPRFEALVKKFDAP